MTANTTPDLAETIPCAPDVETADAVCADPARPEHAIRCQAGDMGVLGVIADGTSGFIINAYGHSPESPLTGKPLVLAGRVPVKVSLENGPIAIGDWLTPASAPGTVMKSTSPGAVIGVALEAFDGRHGASAETGTVLCFVKAGQGGVAQLAAENRRLRDENAAIKARLERIEEALGIRTR